MTLGEIIKQYAKEHSMNEFLKDSGLSRTYTYSLVRNKNKNGMPIIPSLDTVKKVSQGIHASLDSVINLLDEDYVINLGSYSSIPDEYMKLYRSLPNKSKDSVLDLIRSEYEKNKDKIEEYNRIRNEEKISTIDDAMAYLDYAVSFGDTDVIIEQFNRIKKTPR